MVRVADQAPSRVAVGREDADEVAGDPAVPTGDQLKAARTAAGLSQAQAAASTSVPTAPMITP